MNKPLMSALPGLKRKEIKQIDTDGWDNHGDIADANYDLGHDTGYNSALDDLEKYELCEDALGRKLYFLFEDKPFSWEHENIHKKNFYIGKAKLIFESAYLWIKRKDGK